MSMMGMMKQAQQMQANMKKLQEELANIEMEGSAGGDMVKITMTCKNQVTGVKINPQVVDSDDVETLEDMVTAAINDVHKKVEEHVAAEVAKITGGINIPGLT